MEIHGKLDLVRLYENITNMLLKNDTAGNGASLEIV